MRSGLWVRTASGPRCRFHPSLCPVRTQRLPSIPSASQARTEVLFSWLPILPPPLLLGSQLSFAQVLRVLRCPPSAPTLLMPLALSPSPKPSPCLRQHPFLFPSLGSKLFSMQSAKTPLPKFYLLSSLRPCPSIFTLFVPCIYVLSTLGSCLPHQNDYFLSHHSGEFRACRVQTL